jgi:hypothetical protein
MLKHYKIDKLTFNISNLKNENCLNKLTLFQKEKGLPSFVLKCFEENHKVVQQNIFNTRFVNHKITLSINIEELHSQNIQEIEISTE